MGAEVGKRQAALDLDITVEYGYDIRELSKMLRENVASAIGKMAGKEVVEININVVDIKLPDTEDETSSQSSRVL